MGCTVVSPLLSRVPIALVFMAVGALMLQTEGKYVATGKCEQNACMYAYSATQEQVVGGSVSKTRISTKVEVVCESVGTYDKQKATQYCFNVANTMLDLPEHDKQLDESRMMANEALKGPFCFVQTEHGKIAAVQYNSDEKASVANLKKSIAAAFQANFKKTNREVEEDPQSRHISTYSYNGVDLDHLIMHRTVTSDDIIQLSSTTLSKRSSRIKKQESVEYKNGILLNSEGTSSISLTGPVVANDFSYTEPSESDLESYSERPKMYDAQFGTNELSGSGTYNLKLEKCYGNSKKVRRSTSLGRSLTEQQLSAVLEGNDIEQAEIARMRKKLPSLLPALTFLRENISDTQTAITIKQLLELESVYGPSEQHVPAVVEVLDYLQRLSDTKDEKSAEFKMLLYSFLSADGRLPLQRMMINAIRASTDQKERNTLIVQLAFLRHPHRETLESAELMIAASNDTADPLILSYGAMASSAPPELQRQAIQFLKELVNKANSNDDLVHIVHSLGNAQSNQTDDDLVLLMEHENHPVRLAAIYALRHRVEALAVQAAFLKALQTNASDDVVQMVIRALRAGTEFHMFSDVVPIVGESLAEALVMATENSTELRAMLLHYLQHLKPEALTSWSNVLSRAGHQKRSSTTNWNDNDEAYNLVSDLSSRSQDVSQYPLNRAFLWTHSIGVPQVKLDLGLGAFAGFGGKANPTSYKLFGRGLAVGYVFGYTKTAFEALLLSENPPGGSAISNQLYITIAGKTILKLEREIPTCKTWTKPLYTSPVYTLLDIQPSIFIYVGYLRFSLSLSVMLGLDASLTACVQKCISATGALQPKVTVTGTVGASASIAEIVQGGIDVSVVVEYKLTLQLTAFYNIPNAKFGFCFNLLHEATNSKISVYVFYQTRSVTWCKTWKISYPCGISWSDKIKWESLSKEWSLPSFGPSPLWSSCDKASSC